MVFGISAFRYGELLNQRKDERLTLTGKESIKVFENKDYFKCGKQIESTCLKRADLPSSPFLSIIIPAYGKRDILLQAIESAISQVTSVNYEIVIADNNQNEQDIQNLKERLQSSRFRRVSYYVNAQNLGMCGNHNRGALLARGTYITYLHTDDILCRDFVELLYSQLSAHNGIEALYFKPYFSKMGSPLPTAEKMEHVRSEKTGRSQRRIARVKAFDIIPYKIQTAPCEMVMKRTVFLRMGGYNTNINLVFDTEFAMRCVLYQKRVYWLDDILFIKRFGESASHMGKKEMIHGVLNLLAEFCKHTHYPYQRQMAYYRVQSLCRDWQGHHTARQMELELPKYMEKPFVIRRCQLLLRFYYKYFWYLHVFDERGLNHEDQRNNKF